MDIDRDMDADMDMTQTLGIYRDIRMHTVKSTLKIGFRCGI
jgi:hypothetical protein